MNKYIAMHKSRQGDGFDVKPLPRGYDGTQTDKTHVVSREMVFPPTKRKTSSLGMRGPMTYLPMWTLRPLGVTNEKK